MPPGYRFFSTSGDRARDAGVGVRGVRCELPDPIVTAKGAAPPGATPLDYTPAAEPAQDATPNPALPRLLPAQSTVPSQVAWADHSGWVVVKSASGQRLRSHTGG